MFVDFVIPTTAVCTRHVFYPVRFGAAFLVRVGQLETQLYDACLGTAGDDDVDSKPVSAIFHVSVDSEIWTR